MNYYNRCFISNTSIINNTNIKIDDLKKNNNFIISINQIDYKKVYKIIINYIDTDGNKCYTIIENLKPYFLIEKSNASYRGLKLIDNIEDLVSNCSNDVNNKLKLCEKNYKPFNYYSKNDITYYYLEFDNIANYKKLFYTIKNNQSYKYLRDCTCQNETPNNYYEKIISEYDILSNSNLIDKTLVMTWDIESHSYDKSRVPTGSLKDDICFLICGTFHYYDSDEILGVYVLSLVDFENDIKDIINKKLCNGKLSEEKILTILCKSEKKLILNFIELIKNVNPDIVTGFNDFKYDWVFLKHKLQQYEISDVLYESINNNIELLSKNNTDSFAVSKIKISPEDNDTDYIYPISNVITFIDTRIAFRKIFPKTSESSLKYFLKICDLDSKEDLPYTELFKIYENKDVAGMTKAIIYCITDSFRCQQLLKIKNVLLNYNVESKLVSSTLNKCFTRATSYKVFNYLVKWGKGYAFNYDSDNLMYDYDDMVNEGGYVIEPDTSLNLSTPVIGLDFTSLYPNIQRTFNLSPDVIVREDDVDKYLEDTDLSIRKICDRYVVDHNENEEHKGLLVKILTNLYDQRRIIKKQLVEKKNIKEVMNVNGENVYIIGKEIDELNRKQLHVKLLMNSFYGLLDSRFSKIYNKYISTTITTLGRNTLKMVKAYVESKGYFYIYYGDTDSLYVACKREMFKSLEDDFLNKKIDERELFKHKINETKKHIGDVLLPEINLYIKEQYKYEYIRMEYEEVLFPVQFMAKKKYMGIEHIGVINYDNVDDNLFLRGYSIVRKTSIGFSKHIIKNMLIKQLFSMETFKNYHINHMDDNIIKFNIIKGVILDIVKNINENKYPVDWFIKNDKYSIDKDNIRIKTFVKKLQDRLLILKDDDAKRIFAPPETNERFKYVYVKKNINNNTLKKGDIMEYPEYIDYYNCKIDYLEYFSSDVANDLACILTNKKSPKSSLIKLFKFITENYCESTIEYVRNMNYDDINESSNIKEHIKKNNLIRKENRYDYNELMFNLFKGFKNLTYYDFIYDPKNVIAKIDANVNNINFNRIYEIKSNIYENIYKNKYYLNNDKKLLHSLMNIKNVYFNDLTKEINKYIDHFNVKTKNLIDTHIENKNTLLEYDNEIYNELIEYIDNNKILYSNVNVLISKYFDAQYKCLFLNKQSIFINKLKCN
tara:strand:- start:6662 stop:10165 length:3504 start_codon:yes stop_codon:yes gene_type:complete